MYRVSDDGIVDSYSSPQQALTEYNDVVERYLEQQWKIKAILDESQVSFGYFRGTWLVKRGNTDVLVKCEV